MPLTTSLNTGFRCFPREKNFDNELERAFIFFFSDMDCSLLSWIPKSKTSESCGVCSWLKSGCEPEEADSTGEVNEDSGRGQLSEMKTPKLYSNNNQVNLEMVAFCFGLSLVYFILYPVLFWTDIFFLEPKSTPFVDQLKKKPTMLVISTTLHQDRLHN